MKPEKTALNFETAAVHLGQEPDQETGAVIPPIYATSTFAQRSPGETTGYDYTRSGNPSFSRLETTLAALEQANHATVFGSGMAAITAIISTLKAGDLVVAEENIYGCTYRIFDQVFDKFGVRIRYADLSAPENYRLVEELQPTMVWIESPTNPSLKVLDIAALAARTSGAGIPLVVDNTFASPYFQNRTQRQRACQVDLLIHTQYTLHVCEIKFQRSISSSIIHETQEKLEALAAPKSVSLRPTLIHCGELTPAIQESEYFDHIISLDSLLEVDE